MQTALVAILLVLCSSVYSQNQIAEKPEATPFRAQEKAKAQERGTEDLPLVVKAAKKSEDEAKSESAERENKMLNESWMTRATIWLALVTTALAWFTYWLWSATKNLVKETTQTANKQLRAYVSATPNYIFNFSTTIPAQMQYLTENHGLTPARNFRRAAVVEIFPHPLPNDFAFPDLPPMSQETYALQPRQTVTSTITASRLFSEQEINDAARNNGKRIYCFGVVKYVDIFGEERITNFCRSIVGNDDLVAIGTVGLAKSITGINYAITDQHNEAT